MSRKRPDGQQPRAHRHAGAQNAPANHVCHRRFRKGWGLVAHGPDILALFRGAAEHVDKILRGTSPGDLPVE